MHNFQYWWSLSIAPPEPTFFQVTRDLGDVDCRTHHFLRRNRL